MKLFDILGNMGVWIRLNDSRTDPPPEEGRAWGEPVDGFALSIAVQTPDTLSVLLKNTSDLEKHATLPPWVQFFQVTIDAPLKAYGRRILETAHPPSQRTFPPHTALSTDLPLASLYALSPGGNRVTVTCQFPAASQPLHSNELALK